MGFTIISFSEITENYGSGNYDGREFVLVADEDITIEGQFTDDERLFILTQWEMQQ